MKKIIAVLGIFVLLLCGCGKDAAPEAGSAGLANPVTKIPAETMAEELGLREIPISGKYSKISGDSVIYSIDSGEYNIRIMKRSGEYGRDISGVYLGKNVVASVFDSADENISPSLTAECDGSYCKAYCDWNGYVFSVSRKGNLTPSEMYSVTVDFACQLIGKNNIK